MPLLLVGQALTCFGIHRVHVEASKINVQVSWAHSQTFVTLALYILNRCSHCVQNYECQVKLKGMLYLIDLTTIYFVSGHSNVFFWFMISLLITLKTLKLWILKNLLNTIYYSINLYGLEELLCSLLCSIIGAQRDVAWFNSLGLCRL